MSKKLTYEFVKNKFKEEGYELLSTKYINSKTKLEYSCPKGHRHSINWRDFSSGYRCAHCAGTAKPSYAYIKEAFEVEGYILLSNDYVNNKTKLDYLCSNGHKHSICWCNFIQGQRCPYCSNNNFKHTYEFIKNSLALEGYTLLSSVYNNQRTKLKTSCTNGHIHNTTWEDFKRGSRCAKCSKSGELNNWWKGGISSKNLPLYTTYVHQLVPYHSIYEVVQDDLILLGTECAYCNQVFVPKQSSVRSRLLAIQDLKGEHNFYCSDNCKKACPTYNQKRWPKGFKTATSREVQPELRKLVLSRDSYQCQICEAGLDEAELHCHHITGVGHNPIESADIDNCITLCKKHHKQVHTLPDCGYHELKCKN